MRTDYSDTHPSLADRLTAIGYWQKPDKTETIATEELPPLPAQAAKLASEYFLGATADKFIKQFDREWQTRVKEQWKARHQILQETQKRIDELDAKDQNDYLNADELYERACLITDKYGSSRSLPYLRELILLYPQHAAGNFTLGSLLLEENDETGIAYLKEAIKAEPKAELAGNEKIFLFLQSRGREDEARPYLAKTEEAYERLEAANKERETVSESDKFELPTLPAEHVRAIQERLKWHEEISAAYLVRKNVKNMPEHPCHILCIEVKRKFFTLRSGTLSSGVSEQDLLNSIINQVQDVGIQFVVIFGDQSKGIKRKVKKLSQAKIYEI